MADLTARLGLPLPLANEYVTRGNYRILIEAIDAAAAKQADVDVLLDAVANSVLAGTGAGTSSWDTSPTLAGKITSNNGNTGTFSLGPDSVIIENNFDGIDKVRIKAWDGVDYFDGLHIYGDGHYVDLCPTEGMVCIGDTANTKMTTGLTINQGAANDELFAGKSSSVAHGMTDIAETDTYVTLMKCQAAAGGALLTGISDADGSAGYGLMLRGIVGEAVDTTKTTAALGAVMVKGNIKADTSVANCGADGNVLVIQNNVTARFIFDAEGSAHADVEWIAYDTHDDVALLNALDAAMTKDPVKTAFGQYLSDYRQQLQDARIVNFYDDGPRAMVNTTRLAMLHTGAIRQLGRVIDELTARLQLAESRLAALPVA